MKNYCLSIDSNPINGLREVHVITEYCRYQPGSHKNIDIGCHESSESAMNAAKEIESDAVGCSSCMPEYYQHWFNNQ